MPFGISRNPSHPEIASEQVTLAVKKRKYKLAQKIDKLNKKFQLDEIKREEEFKRKRELLRHKEEKKTKEQVAKLNRARA